MVTVLNLQLNFLFTYAKKNSAFQQLCAGMGDAGAANPSLQSQLHPHMIVGALKLKAVG